MNRREYQLRLAWALACALGILACSVEFVRAAGRGDLLSMSAVLVPMVLLAVASGPP